MMMSDQPDTVTVVACPPAGAAGATANQFIDAALACLTSKRAKGNRIIRASCIRDIDIQLGELLPRASRTRVRLQIVGHSISGVLSLGASWIPDDEVATTAFRFPFYVLDTNPAALGLLAKYVGKITEVMLVGCNVGAASSFGYAINGRTLTYTLAELLRCRVRGADDVVAPDEFDARGWYAPGQHHRAPKGWRWVDGRPPMWDDLGIDPVPTIPPNTPATFRVRSITSALLPVPLTSQLDAEPTIQITCKHGTSDIPQSALPELTLDTDQGEVQLLCGGRYLKIGERHYVIDRSPQLINSLAELLWNAHAPAPARTSLAG
jgi:hypothetical protein